jgi:hypothetical protein
MLGDLEDYELEEYFDDTMNKEFNCLIDDNSSLSIARLILDYNKLYLNQEFDHIFNDLKQRFPECRASDASLAASVKFKFGNHDVSVAI